MDTQSLTRLIKENKAQINNTRNHKEGTTMHAEQNHKITNHCTIKKRII